MVHSNMDFSIPHENPNSRIRPLHQAGLIRRLRIPSHPPGQPKSPPASTGGDHAEAALVTREVDDGGAHVTRPA